MDNIKDRQFYWEVKQFFNGKPENNVSSQPKPSLKDAVSGVLKENNPYKQTTFSNNQTSVNAAQNAIQGLGTMDAANKPSCVAYTKNAIKNPFNLNEGFWDTVSMAAPGALEVEDRRRQARANSTQQNFGSPTAPRTEAQQQLERDAASGKPGTQSQAYYSKAPMVQDLVDTYKEKNPSAPSTPDNKSFFEKAADQANNPEKYGLGMVGKVSANVANFFGGFGPTNKPREATGTASTDKAGNTVFNPTPVQNQTPKTSSTTAPVQGQSQAPDAQTKAPVQGQPQSVPAKNQPTATSTTPYKRQYVSSEPEGQPQRGPGGGVIADQSKFTYKASENPEAYKGMDDRRALGQVPMGGEVVGPNGIQKPGTSPFVKSLQDTIRKSAPQNTQFTPSAGQYRNRGSSNMGMATRPNRPEAMTLQSAMAQQNQQATRSALGQMGAVQGTPASSSGFQGSVLPPIGQLSSMGTQKENEFKYSRGSRLA